MPKLSPITQDLILRSKAYQQGMADATAKLKRFSRSSTQASAVANKLAGSIKAMGLAAVGAVGIGGLGSLLRSTIAFGSSQADIASQLGINSTAFQVYSGAMKDAGGTQEQMEKSILAMQQAIVQGSERTDGYAKSFERLGLNVKSIRNLAPEKQFEAIAKAVANAKDQQAALTSVSEIFGKRNAPQLIEVMRRLSTEGFGGLAESVRETFGIMHHETQRRLKAIGDRIDQLKSRATIRFGEIIAGEANGAAFKILGAQLAGAAARFSVGLIDAVVKAGLTIPALLYGAMEAVGHKLAAVLPLAAIKFKIVMEQAINAVIIKFNELSGASIQTLRVSWRQLAAEQAVAANIMADDVGIIGNSLAEAKKIWETDPLKAWKDSIAEGTDYIIAAHQQELDASRAAAEIRTSGAKDALGILQDAAAATAETTGMSATGKRAAMSLDSNPLSAPLQGESLRQAANQKNGDIRFERQGEGSFQRFFQGAKAGTFTQAQLQSGLGQSTAPDKMDSVTAEKTKADQEKEGDPLMEILNILKQLQSALSGA